MSNTRTNQNTDADRLAYIARLADVMLEDPSFDAERLGVIRDVALGRRPVSHQGEPTRTVPPHSEEGFANVIHGQTTRPPGLDHGWQSAPDSGEPTREPYVRQTPWRVVVRCPTCGSDNRDKLLPPCEDDGHSPNYFDPWHSGEPTEGAKDPCGGFDRECCPWPGHARPTEGEQG
jgi:hypothetical protein